MKEITYPTEKIEELFLTENVKLYVDVLERLFKLVCVEGFSNNLMYSCNIITDEEIEFFDILSESKIKLSDSRKHVDLLKDIMLNYERIRNSTSFTVTYEFDSFISKLNKLEGFLALHTYIVIKGY